MPRLKTDYSRTIIYKLVRNNDFENANVYVGSTTEFIKRKNCHKWNCNNENSKIHNLKVYKTIRENGGWSEWSMIEIEKYPCNDKREAEAREEYWRCEYNARLNSNRAFITEEQITEYNKEYKRKYAIEHTEKIKEYKNQYKTEHAETIKEQNKQYRTEHAEKIKERKKKYNTENAEKINQKYECECGGKYTNSHKSRHFTTKKHLKYLNNKIEMI
jgi:hypothetical protein